MTQSAANRLPIVEEVVATLTSAAGAGHGGAAALRAGMRRATDQFDEHAAAALAHSLIDSLCQNPDDVRVLETLVILGLAHPGALSQHRISLAAEGKRLATLLERVGQYERAYCVGELIAERAPPEVESPSTQESEAVAQLVRDAEFAAARGRMEAALRCLREAQRLDPGRQDVAAAIRELHRKGEYRKANATRAVRIAVVVTLISGLATAITLREHRIWRSWKALPEAASDDLPGMRARLDGIESMLGRENIWLTMPVALLQRDILQHDIEMLERPVLPILTDVPGAPVDGATLGSAYLEADAARERGLAQAEKGKIREALADLKKALEIAPADWIHRPRVEANVAALEAWELKNPGVSPK